MKMTQLKSLALLLLPLLGCGAPPEEEQPPAGAVSAAPAAPPISAKTQNLFVSTDQVWRIKEIPVCWESNGWDAEKAWTRDAVARTWEANSLVRFTGWGRCGDCAFLGWGCPPGVRIRIADENPRTSSLGSDLDGESGGMTLNFTFGSWSTSCQSNREFCIRAIAAHEFGHALGFAHEQNRPDTPATCDRRQGSDGDVTVGSWDLMSIMNYCNPAWNNNGALSATDITGLRQFYGNPGGPVPLVFNEVDARRYSATGDWDFGAYKAECGPSETISGLSRTLDGAPHAALCRAGDVTWRYPHASCRALHFASRDARGTTSTGDWDYGFYKGECGLNEYAAGVSQGADGKVRALLCCSGAVGHSACASRIIEGRDSRESTSTGDWDYGAYKGECGPGRHLAGVSRRPSDGALHAVLCCQ